MPRADEDLASPAGVAEPFSGERLDSLPWSYQTGRLVALGHDFAIRTNDAAVGGYLERLLSMFAAPGAPAALYSLLAPVARAHHYSVYYGPELLVTTPQPSIALSHLLWHVNRGVVASPGYLFVHAAAAEHHGSAVLLPAPMESGKTTLVAGLVRAGLGYLTDEAAAVDLVSGLVHPYPKPLTVDIGSWSALRGLEPSVDPEVAHYLGFQWQVDPRAIRHGALAPACPARFLVAPSYARGQRARLRPLRHAEALVALAQNSFHLSQHGRRGLELLARVLERCECYQLSLDDLDEACRLVVGLVTGEEPPTC